MNKNMCLEPTTGDSSPSSPTVVGGPGKTLHHDTASSSLSGIGAKIILLRDKAKINNGIVDNGTASLLIEVSSNVVQLVALLVDTWLGCCIMNHDAKHTNSKQLDKGLIFFPLCHGEILRCYFSVTVQVLKRRASVWLHRMAKC